MCLTNSSVSIPRSEFFRFGRLGGSRRACELEVSIPRSEFFRFGQGSSPWKNRIWASFNSSIGILSVRTQKLNKEERKMEGFNSSIGILSVRTEMKLSYPTRWKMFQFLDRNSFGSDPLLPSSTMVLNTSFNSSIGILSVRTRATQIRYRAIHGVSIPRSEFFRFGLTKPTRAYVDLPVSIPRSEFFRFGRVAVAVKTWIDRRFQFLDRNSFGSDQIDVFSRRQIAKFQFLDRNSFGSDHTQEEAAMERITVSIPRSEFFRFGPCLVVL